MQGRGNITLVIVSNSKFAAYRRDGLARAEWVASLLSESGDAYGPQNRN